MNATPLSRDCHDCGRANTMKLQNALGSLPQSNALVYICYACGMALKIPERAAQARVH